MMTSFVQEVLAASGRSSGEKKDDFSLRATKLKNRVDELKFSLRERIESRYEDFSASFFEVSTTVNQLEDILRDIDNLEQSINFRIKAGLVEAGRDSMIISKQLKDLSNSVELTNLTRNSFEDLEKATNFLDSKRYLESSCKLKDVENVLSQFDINQNGGENDEDTIQSLMAIGKERDIVKQKLSYILGKDWDENVKIIPQFETEVKQHNQNDNLLQSTTFQINFKSADDLQKLVQAMDQCDVLPFRHQKFTQKLFQYIVKPFILNTASNFVSNDREATITFKNGGKEFDDQLVDKNPLIVLKNLEELCIFMSKNFKFCVNDNQELFISKIGKQIGQSLLDLLLKQCLIRSIPDSKTDLQDKFIPLKKAIISLQKVMTETKFMNKSETNSLSGFIANVNETFVNKRCKTILKNARNLMKKDLHVTKIIEGSSPLDQKDLEQMLKKSETFPDISIEMDFEEQLLPLPQGMTLVDGLFKFPKCQVSKSMIELKDLIDNVIKEALEEKDDSNFTGRLLVTVRNIFEMYNDILPVSHAENLKSFPLNSALGFNNCMYLAHECLQIFIPAYESGSLLQNRPITFADLVPKLRQTGVEVLMSQMRALRDQLRSTLRDSVTGLGQLDGSNLLPASSEKCVKQVLHQMLHLKSLWQDVLPLGIYRRTIGTLLNSIVEEMVQRVLILEDIAADAAVQIVSIFTALQDKAPEVFHLEKNKETSKGDIIRYVKKWNRFRELVVILNASMREIEDRWATGKGPLANEFTADEIKRMIRALFQNTDRRAAVLSRIR